MLVIMEPDLDTCGGLAESAEERREEHTLQYLERLGRTDLAGFQHRYIGCDLSAGASLLERMIVSSAVWCNLML